MDSGITLLDGEIFPKECHVLYYIGFQTSNKEHVVSEEEESADSLPGPTEI